jgi:CDP-diacylglycerol---glycerol-3-phosphate 3-phosphatidyltransferase
VTAPNWLTLTRVALVPVYVVLLLGGVSHGDEAAAVVFGVAALTDRLDGQMARSSNTTTTFGAFLDPLADKLLVSCALIALVSLDRLGAWVAMVVIAREFAVTGLRLLVASEVVISASWLGKWKTTLQMAAILALTLDSPYDLLNQVLVGGAVVLTIWSGVDYFVRSRHLLLAGMAGAAR